MIGAQSHRGICQAGKNSKPGVSGPPAMAKLSLHATDGDYGIFLAFGVDSPEVSKFRLIHVANS